MVGNPVQSAKVFNSRGVDELVFVDIFAKRQKRKLNKRLVADVIAQCFMPVGIGGNIETLDDIESMLSIGADKVVVQSAALVNRQFVSEAANTFGSQAITVALDARQEGDQWVLHDPLGGNDGADLWTTLSSMDQAGAGEIVLTDIGADGMMEGYSVDLFAQAVTQTQLPIVANGGAKDPSSFVDLFSQSRVQAAAAASIFYFTQYTPLDIKRSLSDNNIPVRLREES